MWKTSNSPSNNLTRHTGLCCINQCFSTESVNLDAQLIDKELARLSTRMSVPCDDSRRVDFGLDELVCTTKELSGDYDNGCSAISDFLVLLLSKIHENAPCWMLNLEHRKNRRSIVGDGYFLLFARCS